MTYRFTLLLLSIFLLLSSSATSAFAVSLPQGSSTIDGITPNLEKFKKFIDLISNVIESVPPTQPKPELSKVNLVRNGGFEDFPPPGSAHPGWFSWGVHWGAHVVDAEHFKVPSGKYAVELVVANNTAIAQVIQTTPKKSYYVSFLLGDAKNDCHGDMTALVVGVFGEVRQGKIVSFNSIGEGHSETRDFIFQAAGPNTVLLFYSLYKHTKTKDSSTACGPVIDEVKVFDNDEVKVFNSGAIYMRRHMLLTVVPYLMVYLLLANYLN